MDKEYIMNLYNDINEWVVQVRRELHKIPEISLNEYRTKEKIINYLNEIGVEYTDFKGHNGIMAYIINPKNDVTIGIRADIDALPIKEENNHYYKSENEGVMHACGHDAHTAMLLGACKILYIIKEKLNVNVKFFFQPAEETIGGAKFFLEDNCLENPKVDYMFGLHVAPHIETGYIESKYGILNASANSFEIIVKGKNAHGAYPEKGNDALLASAHIITAIQSIVSRNISPLDSGVITIGQISGGKTQNIICDLIVMKGTIRSLNQDSRRVILERLGCIVNDIAKSFNCEGILNICKNIYPAIINDNDMVDIIKHNTEYLFGEDRFIMRENPSLGGEDFSFYTKNCKGVFFHIGCKNDKLNINYPLHTSKFDIDERCLKIGTLMHVLNVIYFN